MGLTKAQLEALNDSSFPNNNAGAITPEILRNYNDEVILNTVNQDVYTADSASFSSRINSISGSGGTVNTGSLVTTASFNAYTQSTANTIATLATTASVTALSTSITVTNNTQTNLINGKLDTSSFNTFSASVTNEITAIESFTASVSTSVGLLQTFSGSQYKNDSSSFDNRINAITASGGGVSVGTFNSYTASQDFKNTTFATTSSLSDLSGSIFSTDATQSSQINGKLDTSSFNTFSTSVDSRINAITGSSINTSSFATTGSNVFIGNQTISGSLFISGSEVVAGDVTASRLRVNSSTSLGGTLSVAFDTIMRGDLTVESTTPQIKLRDNGAGGFSSGYDLRVDTGSFEIYDDTHNRNVLSDFFNSASQQHTTSLTSEIIVISGSTSVTLLGNVSASIISASTINGLGDPLAFSTSVDSRINALTGSTINTSSFATTGSNVFVGDQYVSNGVLQVATYPQTGKTWFSPTAIEAVGTASVAYEQFVDGGGYDTFNVITTMDSGSEFRDLPSDTFVLNTWLQIPQNTGNNPSPQFKRGLGVTGSANFEELTGSLGAFSASISNRINNVSGSGGTINTGSFATTGSNTFIGDQTITGSVILSSSAATELTIFGNQTINGVVQISSSATYDLDITGAFQATAASRVSSSAGVANITPAAIGYTSNTASISSTLSKGLVGSIDSTGAPTTFKSIQISANPSVTGVSSLTSITNPCIIVASSSVGGFIAPIQFQDRSGFTDGRVTFTTPIQANSDITASKILVTDSGTTAIQYQQQSTGSVMGVFNTSYGKDNIKVYQYQGQPYAFNVNLTANQINAYTGSQFEWGLQLNGSNVSLPGGGGTYFAMSSGSTTGSGAGGGEDKLGLNYLGTGMILDMYADTSFRRGVYVDKGMFVSQSMGGSQRPALTVDGTNAANSRAIVATGSVDITGSLTVNGTSVGAVGYGSYYTTTTNSGSVLTFLTQESAVGFENVSGSFIRTTQSGVFQVTANVVINNGSSTGTPEINLKKNGSTIVATTAPVYTSGQNENNMHTTTAIVSMNVNDYIEVGTIFAGGDTATSGRVSITKIA